MRNEQIKCSHQVKRVKESLSKEKKEKLDLQATIKSLKADKLEMETKVSNLTKNLFKEVEMRKKLEDKIMMKDTKYLNVKEKYINEKRK